MDPNGLAEAIDKRLTFLPQKTIKNKELAWNAHATFKGVWLKHLIKGENTDQQFSYHLVKVAAGCEIGEHVHKINCELHTVIVGTGRSVLDETAIDYQPGILAVIPKGLKHRVIAGDEDLYLLATFTPALGEVHACRPNTGGTHSYRTLCIDNQALRWITSEFAGSIRPKPFFRDLVIQDRQLYQKILRLCLALDDSISTLNKEGRLLSLLAYLIVNHAVDAPDWYPVGKERPAVKLAREYIDEHCLNDISISQLASISLLSPYHLMRVQN